MSSGARPRIPPLGVDWIMAFLTAAAFLGAASISSEENTRPVDATAVAFALLLGGALLLRRNWPLGVFIASLLIVTIYMALGYPAVGLAFPLAASVYTQQCAAARSRPHMSRLQRSSWASYGGRFSKRNAC
jgi:hypothetical protein